MLSAGSGRRSAPGRLWRMSDISLTILHETPADSAAIERLHARTFGPGRFARSAFRIRERLAHDLALSFTARVGTLMVGSIRQTRSRRSADAASARR